MISTSVLRIVISTLAKKGKTFNNGATSLRSSAAFSMIHVRLLVLFFDSAAVFRFCFSAYEATVPAGRQALIKTDLSIAIPPNTYARIAPRSGLAVKKMIDVGAGVVDYDYRGPVGVVLFNHGSEDFKVQKGDRVAQLILERICMADIEEVIQCDLFSCFSHPIYVLPLYYCIGHVRTIACSLGATIEINQSVLRALKGGFWCEGFTNLNLPSLINLFVEFEYLYSLLNACVLTSVKLH